MMPRGRSRTRRGKLSALALLQECSGGAIRTVGPEPVAGTDDGATGLTANGGPASVLGSLNLQPVRKPWRQVEPLSTSPQPRPNMHAWLNTMRSLSAASLLRATRPGPTANSGGYRENEQTARRRGEGGAASIHGQKHARGLMELKPARPHRTANPRIAAGDAHVRPSDACIGMYSAELRKRPRSLPHS